MTFFSIASLAAAAIAGGGLDPTWAKLGQGCCRDTVGGASVVAVQIVPGVAKLGLCKKLCQD